jgi:hypothetical protein
MGIGAFPQLVDATLFILPFVILSKALYKVVPGQRTVECGDGRRRRGWPRAALLAGGRRPACTRPMANGLRCQTDGRPRGSGGRRTQSPDPDPV